MQAFLLGFPWISFAFILAAAAERIGAPASWPRSVVETRPPCLRVMRRRSEMGPGGAAPCRKVEAFGVEPDARQPGRRGNFMPREPRELGLAKRVHLREEPFFGLHQRRFALA